MWLWKLFILGILSDLFLVEKKITNDIGLSTCNKQHKWVIRFEQKYSSTSLIRPGLICRQIIQEVQDTANIWLVRGQLRYGIVPRGHGRRSNQLHDSWQKTLLFELEGLFCMVQPSTRKRTVYGKKPVKYKWCGVNKDISLLYSSIH